MVGVSLMAGYIGWLIRPDDGMTLGLLLLFAPLLYWAHSRGGRNDH